MVNCIDHNDHRFTIFLILGCIIIGGSIYGYMYYQLLYNIDDALWDVKTCSDIFDYVNSHDESTQSIQTVRASMNILYDCTSSALDNDQSIKIIKESRPPNPKTKIDADIKVEFNGGING